MDKRKSPVIKINCSGVKILMQKMEKKIEKLQPLEDKKDSKTINQDDDFDKEIENYHEKKI